MYSGTRRRSWITSRPPCQYDLSFPSIRFPTQTRLARFQIKSFEQEAVVFDTASGDTHYLVPFSVVLLQLVQSNPGMTLDEMHGALASRLSLGVGSDLVYQTDLALASLRQIGLLETP